MDGNAAHNRSMILVVMGVSGSGKTTIARLLAERFNWEFQEGDALHPPENVEKMRHGTPLTDADRLPWLHLVARSIDEWRARGRSGVLTCSALKRSYRAIIIGQRPGVRLVYLKGSRELIKARIEARHGHFMPASLLDSQFEALEEPGPEEHPVIADIDASPQQIVEDIARQLEN
jgi:carbohydrate kinase (thermoresistant glucokinase family)